MKRNTEWVDFKEIKKTVSMVEILKHYGLIDGLKRKGNELVGYCPVHDKDHYNKDSFRVNVVKNIWHCFACSCGGNVLDFTAIMEGTTIREAGLRLKEWYGVDPPAPEIAKEKKEVERKEIKNQSENQDNKPLDFELKTLDQNHSYLKERGIEKATVKEFNIGYCKRGLLKGRIAVPIHNEKGELIAYAGRYPGDPPEGESKYRLPSNFKKSQAIFNLHRIQKRERNLILTEGFFDVFKLWQSDFKNTVALMGVSMSEKQEKTLIDFLGSEGKLTVIFDPDEAGEKARKEVVEKLQSKMFIKTIKLEKGKDLDKLDRKEIKKLISQKGS
jgi:DNA primase